MRFRCSEGLRRGAVRKLVSLAVFTTALAGCQAGEDVTKVNRLVDHTTLIYLIDQHPQLRYLSQSQDSPEVLAGLVRKVLAEG